MLCCLQNIAKILHFFKCRVRTALAYLTAKLKNIYKVYVGC